MREYIQEFNINSNEASDIESKEVFLNKHISREVGLIVRNAKEGDIVTYTIVLHFKDLGGLNG